MNIAINQQYFSPVNTIINDTEAYVRELVRRYPAKADILNQLIHFHFRHRISFPSQISMSKFTGHARETANRAISEFKKLGIIKSRRRYNNSCVYELSNYFTSLEIIHRLKYLLPAYMKVLWRLSMQVTLGNFVSYDFKENIKEKSDLFGGTRISLGRKYQFSDAVEMVMTNIREKIGLGDMVKPSDIMSPVLESLKELGFRLEDRIILSRFSDEALAEVKKLYLQSRGVKNKMAWFYSMCKRQGLEERGATSGELSMIVLDGAPIVPARSIEVSAKKNGQMIASPIIQQRTVPKKGWSEIAACQKIAQIKKEEQNWPSECEIGYERIEIENYKKGDSVPSWCKLNPYAGRVSDEFKKEVSDRIKLLDGER